MESICKYLEGDKPFCDNQADQSDLLLLLQPRARARGFLLAQGALHVGSCYVKLSPERVGSEVQTRCPLRKTIDAGISFETIPKKKTKKHPNPVSKKMLIKVFYPHYHVKLG